MLGWASDLRGRLRTIAAMRHDRGGSTPLSELCDRLLSLEYGSVWLRIAAEIQARFAAADDSDKRAFLALLAERYNADAAELATAIACYQSDPGAQTLGRLHAVSEPRRQQILRRLNEVRGGTGMLLAMRRDALRIARDIPGFAALDADFAHLFSSWFNAGFLTLRQLDWSTSGAVLSKLIDYEAVHAIESWQALRARLEPADRRCYAFFHPSLEGEPLIFVEVALTTAIPTSIADVLRLDRPVIRPSDARTAVFYSISNCQEGLRGIPFGGPLIKQVVDVLRTEFPALRQAVTLSPMPGFARWLAKRAETDAVDQQLAEVLAQPGWHEDAARTAALKLPVLRAAARYLLNSRGREADAVARFHLGNGARVQQLDWLGDTSPKGLAQSHGMMVNYLYDPAHIDANYRAYHDGGTVAASSTLRKLVRDEAGASILPWRTAREYR